MESSLNSQQNIENSIAIVGMSGRFPGANNIDQFWENLKNGVDSISTFSDKELEDSGVPEELYKDVDYIRKGGAINDPESFDASFFNYSGREINSIDPQQRFFLECSWEALEHAGYNYEDYDGSIGVYGGCGAPYYLLKNLLSTSNQMESAFDLLTFIGNEKDFLTTRVSYKLNLKGPSVTVQTACSTSLVAVQLACQSLMSYQCDTALAGGVSMQYPRMRGYHYKKGHILSEDGFCRAFDKDATGTIFGEGVGIVVLKRLEDAISDGDTIHAVINGIAINNDGSDKVGYTAPSVTSQSSVISMAQALAEVHPEEIQYIEAHGTGTPLGDPIEIEALTQSFREYTDQKQYCAIGSVKTNIGHLDVAAGVVSLIKAALILKHKQVPPTLHFNTPNPELHIEKSPFYVANKLLKLKDDKQIFIGVSSFGMGGTNAHAVLSNWNDDPTEDSAIPWQLFLLSAKTDSALLKMSENLLDYFRKNQEINIADVAYTLQTGRKYFKFRKIIVAENMNAAIDNLSSSNIKRIHSGVCEKSNHQIVFMFTGQGAQYIDMAKELYESIDTIRNTINICAKILHPIINLDIRTLIYPTDENRNESSNLIKETSMTQPALFTIEYALAKYWMSIGIEPSALIGHSIGEYVAACIAGVFSLEEALKLVSLRGQLMQAQKTGSMCAISLSEEELLPCLDEELSLAVINAPTQCVVSGETSAIDSFINTIKKQNETVTCQKLKTSHAFHSSMMEPASKPLLEYLNSITLNQPQIPFISNVTGTWISQEEATAPEYWAKHLRQTVRFSQGVKTLLSEPNKIYLEVGPGVVLSSLVSQHLVTNNQSKTFSSIRHPKQNDSDCAYLYKTVGQLWLEGLNINWNELHNNEKRKRVPLPTYAFERKRHWIERKELKIIESNSTQDFSETSNNEENTQTKEPEVKKYTHQSIYDNLRSILKNLFGFDQEIDLEKNFLEIGLDSLLLSELALEVQNVFSVSINISHLMNKYSNIVTLAEFLFSEIGDTNANITELSSKTSNLIDKNNSIDIISVTQFKENTQSWYSISNPPIKNAKIGKDENGNPSWFIADVNNENSYLKIKV